MMTHLHTTDLARAVGVHPNTVRRYVERGWLPPTPRGANGYRLFTPQHLDCLRVACLVHIAVYPGRAMRLSGNKVARSAVADDWDAALEHARAHLAFVHAERAQAETAVRLLERWATGVAADTTQRPLRIGQVASLLDVSVDMLRNWERNGLLITPRNEHNHYRTYGPAEVSRLRVIRMLGRAGYSQMAMLRMLLWLDRGETANLRHVLDTPAPDEDVYTAADHWLTTLAEQEAVARRLLAVIEEIFSGRAGRQTSPA